MPLPQSFAFRVPNQPECLVVSLSGDWTLATPAPAQDELTRHLSGDQTIAKIQYDTRQLGRWDSLLLMFLSAFKRTCEQRAIAVDNSGLPEGVRGLLELAAAVPERASAGHSEPVTGFRALLGRKSLWLWNEFSLLSEFVGSTTLAVLQLFKGRAKLRAIDLIGLMRDAGPDALPIVGLISVLVGMILAFVGAVQLKMFGAQLFIADLVGLGMAREMGAMMTAIIMAGRTGAAYAAQLGSMQANDEIDALKTFGFQPMEFLVLPRVIALATMMPLLCLYADFLGIFGGALVSSALFDVSFAQYLNQLQLRLHLNDFAVGVGKCMVFGILVAIAGCMRGLACGHSSSAVGTATTSAVVTGIVFIVVSDAVMTLVITALNLL